MQRDPRQRRGDHSDSGSGIGFDHRGEYGRGDRRNSSDRYPSEDSMHRKSRPDRGHMNRSPRRSISRSRSKSPPYRGRGGNDRDPRDPRIEASHNTRDEWTKTTDAFLKNLGAPSNMPSDQGSFDGRSHGGYTGSNSGYAGHGGNSQRPYYPNQHSEGMGGPPRNSSAGSGMSDHQSGKMMDHGFHERKRYDGGRSPSSHDMNARDMVSGASNYRDGRQDGERRQQKVTKAGNGSGDESSDSSSSVNNKERGRKKEKSNGENRKEPIQGITVEQREKLMNQKQQYIDAKLKLEDQLLKLKEEREELKERGNKHEDKIMRDNAKLQKEVKTRVQYVVEVLGKIEAGLKMPVIRNDKQRSTSRSPGKEERRVRRMSPGDEERKEKRNKRKDLSSSDDGSDGEQMAGSREDRKKQKKKRKKSRKSKMSSSDLSDSESAKEGNNPKTKAAANTTSKGFIQVDENIFRTMATMNGLKPDGSSGGSNKSGSSDDMVMGLLSKMSEAYMNSKKENSELTTKVAELESFNDELEKKVSKQQKKIEKLKRKLQKIKHHGKDSDISDNEVEKGSRNDNITSAGLFEDKNGPKRKSHHGEHIPDILLGDVMKIKREDTMSPPPRNSSRSRVVQNVESFKAPVEEKREISIRGSSPLRHPPERVTTKDAEIVRSVRSRMMEKEAEHKQENVEDRGFANEYGTERDKSNDSRNQGSERRYDDRNLGRMEQDGERKPDLDNQRNEREASKDTERRRERSRSREMGRGRRRSDSRSKGRSHSRDRRTRSKSRGRSGSRERRRRSRSRSSEYRYDRRYGDRRDDRGRYGYDYRRDGRQRELDRMERRERERERERERGRSREKDKERDRRDRNDRIDIDEWTTKPSDEKNPGLSSIKEKLRKQQEEEEAENRRKQKEIEENEKKQKWANISTFEEPQKLDPPKSQEMSRPQVAIQWGQRDKVTPDPHNAGMQMNTMKKAMPMVGKMPWLQRSNRSEERGQSVENDAPVDPSASKRASRFGAQVSTTLPPPTVLSNVPAPAVMAPVPPPALSRIQQSLSEINSRNQMGSGQSVGGVTFDHVHGNATGAAVVQPSFRKKNTMPTELDISSMLEAAKQHINRAKESKKDVASILCPTSPPPAPKEAKERTPEEDSNQGIYQNDSKDDMSADMEIPLPPLPAAQDKDPDAMLDTRTKYRKSETPDKDLGADKFREEMETKNLPPGWDRKSAETVQNAPSQPSAPSMMAGGGIPPGTQANNFFGPPGTNYYGGTMSQMRQDPFSGQTQPLDRPKESKPKPDIEGDASELAMLGIDASDFNPFGN